MEGTNSRSEAKHYLVWSILNTIFCCLPLGVVAIIYSVRTKDANAVGDSLRAQEASRTARTLNIVAAVIGTILIIALIVIKLVT